jgi:hypothetical protein
MDRFPFPPDPFPGDEDVCVHGKTFDVICVECCPEDDDGSFTGDEWSEG